MTIPDSLAAALAGRYRADRMLGAGGMATVYLAHDLRFDRDVALKVLHPDLVAALGAERFLREIRLTARLNHPNILTVFDSGEAAGQLFFAMPYIQGESLRERITREGRIGIADALRIAIEVAEALESAHRMGIVHRDIKPENILLGQGHALVSDFGIAVTPDTDETRRLTQTGLVVGTPAYMSPEQAAGDTLDARSDVYALGTVLFEMLAGTVPFAAATGQATIARRLTQPAPELVNLAPDVPARVGAAVQCALATRPDLRFESAGAFADALRADLADVEGRKWDPHRAGPPPSRPGWKTAAALVLLGGALAAVALVVARPRAAPGSLHLTQVTTSAALEQWPTWSPDGASLVYSVERDGFQKLVLRTLATGQERPLTTGPADDIMPSFSPDGRQVAFVRASGAGGHVEVGDVGGVYAGGDAWVLDVATGAAHLVVPAAMNPVFSPDGRHLAFDAARSGPRRIWLTDPTGANAVQVTQDSSDAALHASPSWSPDGTHIAYRRFRTVTLSDIAVVDVATHRSIKVTEDLVPDEFPVWSPHGRYIYFSSARGGGLNIWRIPVGRDGAPSGAPEQLTTGPGNDVMPAVSHDGTALAFSILGINSDVWRLPVDPATGKPAGAPEAVVATTREDSRGAWSPDGRSIAFNSDRDGSMTLWLHDLASGRDRAVTAGEGSDYQPNWSPDGRTIAFFSARAGSNDIWTVSLDSGRLTRLTDSSSMETNPFFSPDGRWIAYQSDRTGRNELWVMRADGTGQRQLTHEGVSGHFQRWSADGTALYVTEPASPVLMRVALGTGAAAPVPNVGRGAHMSFSPDRRLMMDVDAHKTLVVRDLSGGEPVRVFAFDDPDQRIDYPVWSPDGRWVLFDRASPRGGDIWMIRGLR
jgi:Tol biopolymer transport system component